VLRYFVKTEELTDCAGKSGAGTLSNYHIKTLMLWVCELKPKSWCTEGLNLIRICVELLQTLSLWLADARCPHYFVNSCNLLDNSFDVRSVRNKVSIGEEFLSTWFISNYMGQCAQLCPVYISRLFDDASCSVKLQNVVSEIVRWRLNTSLHDLWWAFHFCEYTIGPRVSERSLTIQSCFCWMNELTKIGKHVSVYFSAVALLHIACKISRNCFIDDDVHILFLILGRNFSESLSDFSFRITELNTSELVELLEKSAVEYLQAYRHFLARYFGSVATIVTTDFEALYAYKHGDSQRCLELSRQNVHTLLYAVNMPNVPTFPEFIQ